MLTLSTTDSALELREREREKESVREGKSFYYFQNSVVELGIFSTLKPSYEALHEMKYYSQKCQTLVSYIEMNCCVCVLSLKRCI